MTNRKGPWEFARTFSSKERRLGTRQDEDTIRADNTSQLQLAIVKMQERSLTSFVLRN